MKTIFRYTADILLFLVVNKRFNFSLKIRINFNTKLWLTTRCLLDIGITKWTKFVVGHLLSENFFTLFCDIVDNLIFNLSKYIVALLDDTFTLVESSHRENNLSVTIVGNLDIINNLVKLDHHGISYGVS